jgi:oxygen-independent coproporphyrinogen-3 oxidase
MKMINKELLLKYNKPVPRYTSYPPANFFEDNFKTKDYTKAIIKSNQENPENISIYIHIPFCKKLCHYCGCNTCNMKDEETIKEYIKSVKKEMQLCFSYIDKKRKVSQIHYGGGTPNAIDAKYLKELNDYVFSNFQLIEDAEIAIECNPAYLDEEYIKQLKEAKFNRFSLGIQDFDTQVLRIINRDASLLPVKDLIALLKDGDNKVKVNLDFIYGLPLQSKESFSNTIKQAIDSGADRIVTFSYAHVPWVNKAQMILEKAGLPDNDEKISMYESAYEILCNNNYTAIGLDHYAKNDDDLKIALDEGKLHRNFQGYCTTKTTGQVYAFGVSAISQFESAYVQNTKDINDYISVLNNNEFACIKGYFLNDDEKIIRYIIEKIMCNKIISWKQISNEFNLSQDEVKTYVSPAIDKLNDLESDNIIKLSNKGVEVNEHGVLFIRNVAAAFDPLLKNNKNSFSKPV